MRLLILVLLVACRPAVGTHVSALTEPVSIADFGALGDGTDDRAAIQRALDANAGGAVRVPAGRWYVGRAGSSYFGLAIPAGTTLVGDGDASVLVQLAGTAPSVRLLQVAGAGAVLQDLALDGQRELQSPTVNAQRHGVFARAPFIARRVRAHDFAGDGFYLYAGAATLDAVTSENNARNGVTCNASGTVVTASTFRGNAAQQLDSEPGSPSHVDNVTITGSTFDGLGVSNDYALTVCGSGGGQNSNWRAEGNVINGGLYVVWASDVTVRGNTGLNATSKPSVFVYRRAERITVEDNEFTSMATSNAIAVTGTGTGQGASDVVIRNNRIDAGGAYGVAISGAVSVLVEGNTITNRPGTGQAAITARATNPAAPLQSVVLRRNTATGWARGVSLAGMIGTTARVDSLVATGNRLGAPMWLDEGSGALQRAELTDNVPAEVARWPAGAVLTGTTTMTRATQ